MRELHFVPTVDHTIEDSDAMFEPLLPSQLDPARSIHTIAPEARLALAVLEDAIMTLRAAAGVGTTRTRRLVDEAWAWIASDDTSHPFAFVSVCEHLGLDAPSLRAGVRRWCHVRTRHIGTNSLRRTAVVSPRLGLRGRRYWATKSRVA